MLPSDEDIHLLALRPQEKGEPRGTLLGVPAGEPLALLDDSAAFHGDVAVVFHTHADFRAPPGARFGVTRYRGLRQLQAQANQGSEGGTIARAAWEPWHSKSLWPVKKDVAD